MIAGFGICLSRGSSDITAGNQKSFRPNICECNQNITRHIAKHFKRAVIFCIVKSIFSLQALVFSIATAAVGSSGAGMSVSFAHLFVHAFVCSNSFYLHLHIFFTMQLPRFINENEFSSAVSHIKAACFSLSLHFTARVCLPPPSPPLHLPILFTACCSVYEHILNAKIIPMSSDQRENKSGIQIESTIHPRPFDFYTSTDSEFFPSSFSICKRR